MVLVFLLLISLFLSPSLFETCFYPIPATYTKFPGHKKNVGKRFYRCMCHSRWDPVLWRRLIKKAGLKCAGFLREHSSPLHSECPRGMDRTFRMAMMMLFFFFSRTVLKVPGVQARPMQFILCTKPSRVSTRSAGRNFVPSLPCWRRNRQKLSLSSKTLSGVPLFLASSFVYRISSSMPPPPDTGMAFWRTASHLKSLILAHSKSPDKFPSLHIFSLVYIKKLFLHIFPLFTQIFFVYKSVHVYTKNPPYTKNPSHTQKSHHTVFFNTNILIFALVYTKKLFLHIFPLFTQIFCVHIFLSLQFFCALHIFPSFHKFTAKKNRRFKIKLI